MFSRRPTDRGTGIEGAKGNLRRAFSLSVAYMVAFNIASPMLPLYLTAKGASPALVGAVLALSSVMPLLLGVSLGALVVVHGAARVSVVSAAAFAAAAAFLAPEPGPLGTALLYGLVNVGHLGMMIATQATVAGWSAPEERAAVYGQYTFWVSAGSVAGPVIGGVVAERFGFGAAFGAMFAVSLLAIAAAARIADRPGVAAAGVTLASAYRAAFSLARDGGVAVILVISFLVVGAQSLKLTFYPLLLQNGGMAADRIGLIVAVVNLASMIVRPFLGASVARFGIPIILIGASLVGAAGYLTAIAVAGFAPQVGAAVVMGLAMGFIQPLTMSLMASSVAPPMLGLAMSVRLTIQRLSLILGPLVFGVVVAATSVEVSFYAGAVILAFVAALVARRGAALARGASAARFPALRDA